MRIAIVTTSYPTSAGDASGHFVASEARSLARAGHEVFVLSPFSLARERAGIEHVQVLGLPLFGWPGALEKLKAAPWLLAQAAGFAASVQRQLRRLTPLDKVIAHWIVPSAWPAALGQPALEVVAHGSDVRLLQRLPRPFARHIVSALLLRGATFQCVSEALRADLVELCPAASARSAVRPALLDMSGAPTRVEARGSLGLDEKRLVLVVGRLVASKRMQVALGAARLLTNSHTVVIGDGPELSALGPAFPEAQFLGRLSRRETLTWLAAADLLLTASRDEGSPTVVREAIALGVRVVACPAGDLNEWARHEPLLSVVRPHVRR